MPNPYLASSNVPPDRGIFANNATVYGSSFLFREIQLEYPFPFRLVYSGWWFWQRITVNGQRVWSKISWLTLLRKISFPIPAGEPEGERASNRAADSEGTIEIEFGPGLRIRRFRLWVDGEIVFDEIS